MTEQKALWTDGLGNILWRYDDSYLLTTVMTRTELERDNVKAMLDALAKEFGYELEFRGLT
jgi:hypothetical protein